jgi:hypothetical protein
MDFPIRKQINDLPAPDDMLTGAGCYLYRRRTELQMTVETEIGAASAPETPIVQNVVELRRYALHPGRREDLIALFDHHFVESQEACGMSVLGQFRDLDRPDDFVWLRGFADMESRRRALAAFYDGPVWAEHRDAANATMDRFDDVLLLKPAAKDCAFRLGGWQRPRSGAKASAAVFALYVFPVAEAKADAFHAYFEDVLEPLLIRAGAPVGALFATEPSENTYPRLPVRAGARVCVWLARFADRGEHDAFSARLRGSSGWQDVLSTGFAEHLNGPLCTSRLSPTARSLLR